MVPLEGPPRVWKSFDLVELELEFGSAFEFRLEASEATFADLGFGEFDTISILKYALGSSIRRYKDFPIQLGAFALHLQRYAFWRFLILVLKLFSRGLVGDGNFCIRYLGGRPSGGELD